MNIYMQNFETAEEFKAYHTDCMVWMADGFYLPSECVTQTHITNDMIAEVYDPTFDTHYLARPAHQGLDIDLIEWPRS